MKEKQLKHWKDIIAIQDSLKQIETKILAMKDKIQDLHQQYKVRTKGMQHFSI